MTTRNAHAALFFLSILLSGLMACKKDTVVHGRVVDRVTGEGVAQASVTIKTTYPLEDSRYREDGVLTDASGEFLTVSDLDIRISEVFHPEYLPKSLKLPKIEKNKYNDVTIDLIPIDAFLILDIRRNGAPSDTVYVGLFSPAFKNEFFIAAGALTNYFHTFDGGQHRQLNFSIPSADTISVCWDAVRLPSDLLNSKNKLNVVANRGDTITLEIGL